MDPTPQQAISSLANIAPFLWPFVLLSLGVALTPVSPISWSYSTWLLFIIPLTITVFAPIRSFSGPLRFAHLEYGLKIGSLVVSLLKGAALRFTEIPPLALPAFFFLPVLPLFFFILFPALPVVWHYIAYHYRSRLKAITTSVAKINASLDLAIARARQAVALAQTFEKQTLCTISATQCTPSVDLSRHSTDLGMPVLDYSKGHWLLLLQRSDTLGADLAGKVLVAEKQMVAIEDASQVVRELSEQAVAVATEGNMAAGEKLAGNAADSLVNVVNQVDGLRLTADQARCTWAEFRRRLDKVTTSASTTMAGLDLAVTQARRAAAQAHAYEEQALAFVSETLRSASQTFALHNAHFFQPSAQVERARQAIIVEAGKAHALGSSLTKKIMVVDTSIVNIELEAGNIRALLEHAITATADGDVVEGETLTASAAESFKAVTGSVQRLCSTSDGVREVWVELSLQ